MIPVLQSRWRLEGQTLVYYGLRQPPHLFHRRIWLDRRTAALVASLDGKRDISQYIRTPGFQKLLREGIVTDRSLLRTSPSSLEDAASVYAAPQMTMSFPALSWTAMGSARCAEQRKNTAMPKMSCRSCAPFPVLRIGATTPQSFIQAERTLPICSTSWRGSKSCGSSRSHGRPLLYPTGPGRASHMPGRRFLK